MCNCSKNAVVVNTTYQSEPEPVDDSNCPVTRTDLDTLRNLLLTRKTTENSGFVNAQIGLIDTMINYNKFCMYHIEPF